MSKLCQCLKVVLPVVRFKCTSYHCFVLVEIWLNDSLYRPTMFMLQTSRQLLPFLKGKQVQQPQMRPSLSSNQPFLPGETSSTAHSLKDRNCLCHNLKQFVSVRGMNSRNTRQESMFSACTRKRDQRRMFHWSALRKRKRTLLSIELPGQKKKKKIRVYMRSD